MIKSISVGNLIAGIILLATTIVVFDAMPHSLTGYHIIPVDLNLSVDEYDEGRIGYFLYEPEVLQYIRTNVTVEFINTGSTTYNTRIELYLQDWNASTNYSKMVGGYSSVKPGGRVVYSTKFIPKISGFQWIHVIAPYNNKTAEAWALIYVKPYYYEWPPIPPNGTTGKGGGGAGGGGAGAGGGGGAGGEVRVNISTVRGSEYETITPPWAEPDVGIVGFEISYPQSVSLVPGGSAAAYIIANNTGTMMLRNVMVTGHITGARMEIIPNMIYRLPGNTSSIFMVSLEAPENMPPGKYAFEFNVLSNRANKSGHIDINVGEATAVDDSLNQTIANYAYIISRMEDEIDGLKLAGKNMTLASEYINEAKELLKNARDDYSRRDYAATYDKLKRVKRLLIKTAAEIALAKSESIFVALSPASILLYLLIAIILLAGLALYTYHRRRMKKERKKLEGEELGR